MRFCLASIASVLSQFWRSEKRITEIGDAVDAMDARMVAKVTQRFGHVVRRPEAQIGESAYPVSPIGNFGTLM